MVLALVIARSAAHYQASGQLLLIDHRVARTTLSQRSMFAVMGTPRRRINVLLSRRASRATRLHRSPSGCSLEATVNRLMMIEIAVTRTTANGTERNALFLTTIPRV